MHLAPGDPAVLLAGPDAPPEFVDLIRKQLGLDRPLYEQFFLYITNALRGDLGSSYTHNKPVLEVIFQQLPATLLLMGTGYLIALILGIYLGVVASARPHSKTDNVAMFSSLVIYSLPGFWAAMITVFVFGFILRWFPILGMVDIGAQGIDILFSVLHHLVLPALIVSLEYLAMYFRIMRASMLEILNEDYIITAKSKGCSNQTVLYKHALKNALIPMVTIVALRLRYVFTGTVLIETVFAWPGLGRLIISAISQRDYSLLMGVFLIVSILTIFFNMVADVVYGLVDPRIRYGGRRE